MDRVRVAFIGAGSLATAMHYPSLVDLREEVEIVAACDLDAQKAARAAHQFGITRTDTDYRRMLDQTQPDAVYAVLPPHLLFDVAMDAARGDDAPGAGIGPSGGDPRPHHGSRLSAALPSAGAGLLGGGAEARSAAPSGRVLLQEPRPAGHPPLLSRRD